MSYVSEIAAIASGLGAAFSAFVAWLGFQALRSARAPRIVVRVVHDELRQTLLMLVIENVGGSIARGIGFSSDRPIPGRAWGIEAIEKTEPIEPLKSGPLVTGIPALGPGERRRIVWGQYGGLVAALGGKPIQLHADYKDESGRAHSTISFLDVVSFETTDLSTDDPLIAIAQKLDAIKKTIEAGHKH